MKKFFTPKNVLLGFGLLMVDLALYFALAIMLINYEDLYDGGQGAFYSLESMTFWQKINYFSLIAWYVLNIALILYLVYRFLRNKKH